jgi:hypothetical protein
MRRKGSGAQRPTEEDSNSSNTAKLRPIRLLVHFVLSYDVLILFIPSLVLFVGNVTALNDESSSPFVE